MLLAQNQTCRAMEQTSISTCNYSHLMFDRGNKTYTWGKDVIFNKWCWENRMPTHKRLKLYLCLLPCTKSRYKWTKDVILKYETLLLYI